MKELMQFKVLNDSSSHLDALIMLHQSVYRESVFNNKLIYFDENFPNYLSKLFNDENHFIYVVETNSFVIGFAHLRLIDDFLFLNTISVNSDYAGRGLGKKLLLYSIQEVLKNTKQVSLLKLDVFENNHKALNWYKKLGFMEEKITDWYQFNTLTPEDVLGYSSKPDTNGFQSLFSDTTKIATIINNNMVLHDSNYLFHINILKYESVQTNDNSFKSNSLFNETTIRYKLIDKSIRMSVNLDNLTES